MEYKFFKLKFNSGVHFGNGMLNDSDYIFRSDSLFSALYIEALRLGLQDEFYKSVDEGNLIFSDTFPYFDNEYLLPKPIIYIDRNEDIEKGNNKKIIKKIKYIFPEDIKDYLSGKLDFLKYDFKIGSMVRHTKAAVNYLDETVPYHVGVFYYGDNNGLYVMVGYKDQVACSIFEELMESLSYTGIGGEKSSGTGRFSFVLGKKDETIQTMLDTEGSKYMLLSTAYSDKEELRIALDGASYLMIKRSGFVYSDTFSDEGRRKKDMFMFSSGSCFSNKFYGDVFDVGRGGDHPVFRNGKALFMGIDQ